MNTSSATFGHDVEADLPADPDPMPLLCAWIPADLGELRPLMTLCTLDREGFPDARNVLLSTVGADGLTFHTDSATRKAAQLMTDPRAAAVLVWPDAARQVVVQGVTEVTSEEEAAATFSTRSRYLQLLAWTNTPEVAARPAAERQERWARFAADHPGGDLTPPPTWVGFRLRPHRVTFWRGGPEGPSHRVEHRRAGAGWTVRHLPG